jgi:hypothetical protein
MLDLSKMHTSPGPILLMRWLSRGQEEQQRGTLTNTVVRDSNWSNNQQQIASSSAVEEEDIGEGYDDDGILRHIYRNNNSFINSSNNNLTTHNKPSSPARPFMYIGDLDPTVPQPWPKEEVDWWALHHKLVEDVRNSDAMPTSISLDEEAVGVENDTATDHQHEHPQQHLPQLIFYGDSITEGWAGTSFGNRPPKHRLWNENNHEDDQIRQLFQSTFGSKSSWGKRALKQPLVLGISGSRTYDLLWRLENGEFPTSQLLVKDNDEAENDNDATTDKQTVAVSSNDAVPDTSFQLQKLERIYLVLIGTNNLGGGMLPTPTVEGMDAVGRTLLRLHKETFSSTAPAAIVFSELLPRRDDHRARNMCPPRCKNITTLEPYESFMPAIDAVNRELERVADGWRKDFLNSRIVLLSSSNEGYYEEDWVERLKDRMVGNGGNGKEGEHDNVLAASISNNQYQHRINCGRTMFAIDNGDEFDRYMPDRLHPNYEGYELWSRCLKRGLEAVMMDSTGGLEH